MRKHKYDIEDQKKKALKYIKGVAKKLKKTPTIKEYKQSNPNISYDQIIYLFGSWNNAIKAAGLKPNPTKSPPDVSYTKKEVIEEIIKVANQLGHYPSIPEFNAEAEMTIGPVKRIFGSWKKARQHIESNYKRRLQYNNTTKETGKTRKIKNEELGLEIPLKYKPRNEIETLILFSLLARKLGYTIIEAKTGFPDLILEYKGKKIEAECELLSSNYENHGHPVSNEIICICWRKDKEISGLKIIDLESICRKQVKKSLFNRIFFWKSSRKSAS